MATARIRKIATGREWLMPFAAECNRAYVVRAADLQYVAKRCHDGETIIARADKADAKHEAELLGYTFNN